MKHVVEALFQKFEEEERTMRARTVNGQQLPATSYKSRQLRCLIDGDFAVVSFYEDARLPDFAGVKAGAKVNVGLTKMEAESGVWQCRGVDARLDRT